MTRIFHKFVLTTNTVATGFPILPHLLRQMPFRIADYCETISSPAKRDFATLNLLICGKLENRSA